MEVWSGKGMEKKANKNTKYARGLEEPESKPWEL